MILMGLVQSLSAFFHVVFMQQSGTYFEHQRQLKSTTMHSKTTVKEGVLLKFSEGGRGGGWGGGQQ